MKVSKYQNTRAAVGKHQNKKNSLFGGMLYSYPGHGSKNLESRMNEKNKSVQNLYNIFNPVQKGTPPTEPKKEDYPGKEEEYKRKEDNYKVKKKNYERREKLEKYVKELNRNVNRILFSKNGNRKEMEHLDTILSQLQETRFQCSGLSAEEIVALSLRKSLISCKEGAVLFLKHGGNGNIPADDEKQIRMFLDAVRKDFNKLINASGEKSTQIIKSIEHQNLVVQFQKDGDAVLPVSDKAQDRKKEEKGALNEFLLLYANLDEQERIGILRKLRRILEVYFLTPQDLNLLGKDKQDIWFEIPKEIIKTDFNVWKRHENVKNGKLYAVGATFVKVPDDLITDGRYKKSLDKVVEKELMFKLRNSIRERNITCYRFARSVVRNNKQTGIFFDDDAVNVFWIRHIQSAVERILKTRLLDTLYKLDYAYLSEKVWKDLLNYLSIKYIAIGKAVYHFGMTDAGKDNGDMLDGVISKQDGFEGITSFDYEMIKARETLQREMAVHLSFAVNNLARATVNVPDEPVKTGKNGEESDLSDFLLWKKEDIRTRNKGGILDNILQFFGGRSSWGQETAMFQESYSGREDFDVCFLDDLRKMVYALRNESFHFTTKSKDTGEWKYELIGKMFEEEALKCIAFEKKKFYSNNLPRFYNDADLKTVLNRLYSRESSRASQVPSFNKVVVRKNCRQFIINELKWSLPDAADSDTLEWWEIACYYLLKEIYYNDFLQSSQAIKLFMQALDQLENEKNQEVAKVKKDLDKLKAKDSRADVVTKKTKEYKIKDKEKRAISDFKSRCVKLKQQKFSLSEICQAVMTEYNLQNNQKRTVEKSSDSVFDRKIYQHYVMSLLNGLRMAFCAYVTSAGSGNGEKKKIYGFMKQPEVRRVPEESAFLADWKSEKYKELIEQVKRDHDLQKWYIAGRLLDGRALNHLAGSMRSYVQYVRDIEKRAYSAERVQQDNKTLNLHMDETENVKRIENAVKVVEVCIRLSGNYTKKKEDYFGTKDTEDVYAEYLAPFVKYRNDGEEALSPSAALWQFCNSDKTIAGLYMDGQNIILNRNIVQAKLFGPNKILSEVLEPIGKEEIESYYEKQEKIKNYREDGICHDKQEQEDLLGFQRIKNRVELQNITEFSTIINELLGQLINWSFLRERDLLYFQLGFHYMVLRNRARFSTEHKEELPYYEVIETGTKRIQNAILRQVAGMYINGIGIYTMDKESQVLKEESVCAGAGVKISKFCGCYDQKLYEAGLEVFENKEEHKNITDLRNVVDHFKFYTGKYGSILDLYSEVFDRFFTYDMKYRKNVIVLLQNILLRHAVVLETDMESGKKKVGKSDEKERAQIIVRKISADRFPYKYGKYGKEESSMFDARDEEYLETVQRILYWSAEDRKGTEC